MNQKKLGFVVGAVLLLSGSLSFWAWRGVGKEVPPETPSGALKPETPAASAQPIPPSQGTAAAIQAKPETTSEGQEKVLRAAWGQTPGSFGLDVPQEANPEGPSVIKSGPDGAVYLLDSVNNRLQVFDRQGGFRKVVPLPSETVHTFTFLDDGRLVFLDRLDGGSVFIQGEGAAPERLALNQGTQAGLLNELFVWNGQIYVEKEHGHAFLASKNEVSSPGRPTRGEIPGRPARFDGNGFLTVALEGKERKQVSLRLLDEEGRAQWMRNATLEDGILHILMLSSLPDGSIFVGCETAHETPDGEFLGQKTVVLRFDRNGAKTGEMSLPPTTSHPAEVFEPLSVAADGSILQMRVEPSGLAVDRFSRWE